MAKGVSPQKNQSTVGSDLKRRGILRLGTLVTALTGASALSAAGANAAAGDKSPPYTYVPVSEKGAASGVATLDTASKIPAAQIPDLSATFAGATATAEALAGKVSKKDQPVNVKDFGAVGDGVADDSAAIAAALAAAGKSSLIFPVGTYKVASATRLQMHVSYLSLVGDPSGISTIRFTHPNGGIDLGNGKDFIYQNLIQNIVIDGFNVANNPLRLRKCEEMGMSNVRIHQALVSCIEMTDTSLFHCTRLQLARSPIGIKALGYLGTVGMIDANFYLLDYMMSIEGTGVANLVVSGTSFIESVKVGISFNRPAAAISVGTIRFRDCYVTSSLTEFTLFKGVASSGVNATALEAVDLSVYIPNVTTPPFIDFTALNNNGSTLRSRLTDGAFTATALNAGKLVAVHPSQNWFQFFVTLIRLTGVTTAQYATVFAKGGVALTPLQLCGSGTPEAVMTAPVGSIYQNYGGSAGTSIYVKQTGSGNTGWVGK